MHKNLRHGIITVFFAFAVFTAFFLGGKALQPAPSAQAFVDIYGTVPPGFPAGLVPGGTPLTTSRSTKDSSGVSMNVIYQVHDQLPAAYGAIIRYLEGSGWQVGTQRLGAAGEISAQKDGGNLSVLVTTSQDKLAVVVAMVYSPKK